MNKPDRTLRILHLEDDPLDAALVSTRIEAEGLAFEVVHVDDRDGFVGAVEGGRFDLILADYSLPAFDGVSALAIAQEKCPGTPYIFVSGNIGEEYAVECLRKGATDYVLKDRLSRLAPSILRAVREAEERAERIRVEKEALELNEKLRGLVDESPVGAVIVQDGRFIYTNRRFREISGYAEEELLDMRDVFGLLHESGRDELMSAAGRIIGGEAESGRREVRGVRKDGSVVDVELFGSSVKYMGRVAVIVSVVDITERKRAEEAVRESREDLNRAQAVARTGSWRLDVRRNELLWSDENYRLFGVPLGTPLTYETFLSIVHPDDRAFVDRQWQAALQGEPYDIEHRIIADGAVKWVREQAVLEFDHDGLLLGGFGTTQDVTEKRLLEQQKKDFYAMVTHDLKSPLTVIMGNTEFLLTFAKGRLDEDTKEMVAAIDRSSHQLLGLVEDFLTISKMEGGHPKLAISPSDIATTVREARKDVEDDAREKGITLETVVAEGLPNVNVDLRLVMRAVVNLAQNAVNYTPKGGKVTIEAAEAGDGFVAVSVSDTGHGIPPEERERVFEKYYRSPSTAHLKGTGLGLAIVKAVAEAHGGRVELESEVGRGSTFRLCLPVDANPVTVF
ncbi:MAG: PAS domain S-box protein [Nitrospirae bacterium]|nr:PAS domain S-box protein [Nitrospirota bacterium]